MSVQRLFDVDLSLDMVSLVMGFMVFRRSWPFAHKCLFVWNILRVFVSYFVYLWQYYTHTSNHWISNLFSPLLTVGSLLVFYSASTNPTVRRWNKWLLIAFPLVTAICWLRDAPMDTLNLWAAVGFDFLVLLAVCLTFVDLLLRTDNEHFIRQPMFWLASGHFFYTVETVIGYATWEYSKKMILFQLYTFIVFSADYLMDAGVIGCFVCIYLEGRRRTKSVDQFP